MSSTSHKKPLGVRNAKNSIKPSKLGVFICFLARHLGPAFIKLIQLLSSRHDLLSSEMIAAFSKMRDSVPTESKKHVVESLIASFGEGYKEVFTSFDYTPIGSGGVAQVHKAVLKNGDVVAVKILRPRIERRVRKSIKRAKFVAGIVSKIYSASHSKRIDLGAFLGSFDDWLIGQCDLDRERDNIKRFQTSIDSQGFKIAGEALIIVPKTYDELSSKSVLVMEYVGGVHPDRYFEVKKTPLELANIIDDLEDLMIIYNGLVHGDLHPGNFYWTIDGKIVLVDFGMIIEIPKVDVEALFSFYMAVMDGYLEYAAHLYLKVFATEPAKDKLSTEEYQDLYKKSYLAIFEAFADESKPDFLGYNLDMQTLLDKHELGVRESLLKVLLALVTLEGYHYNLDADFNMLENARQKKLNAAVYTETPDEVLKKTLGKKATYSTAISEGFNFHDDSADKAFEKNRENIGKLLNARSGEKVLDVGCGRGHFLEDLKDNVGIIPFGVTLSSVEANICKSKGINVAHTSWEDAGEFASKHAPFEHIVMIEMDCQMCNLEENKNGFLEVKLDRLFKWSHSLLNDAGKLYIQQLDISDEIFEPSNFYLYKEIIETIPFMGFSRLKQLEKTWGPYYDVVELFENQKKDIAFTYDYAHFRFAKYKDFFCSKVDPRIYEVILKELKLLMRLIEMDMLTVNRILLKKKKVVDNSLLKDKLSEFEISRWKQHG